MLVACMSACTPTAKTAQAMLALKHDRANRRSLHQLYRRSSSMGQASMIILHQYVQLQASAWCIPAAGCRSGLPHAA